MIIEFELNNKSVELETDYLTRLVDILRSHFNLTGTKRGCGTGKCGSCLVFMNDRLVNSCLIPAFRVHGGKIITIEGFTGNKAFSSIENAFQQCGVTLCGFCTPGIVMATAALLQVNLAPAAGEIKEALSGNTCRCIGYNALITAVSEAARLMRKGSYGRKR